MKLLHKIIFFFFLFAGVSAGLVFFIMSFPGVVLMYEPQISDYSERSARWVVPGPDARRLSYDELIAKVRAANPDTRPAVIMVKSDPTASVAVNLGIGHILHFGSEIVARMTEKVLAVRQTWADDNAEALAKRPDLRRTVGHPRFHARRRRLAPLARHRRRRPRHGSRHHRRLQSGVFLACRYRRLSLVAA